MALIPLGRWFPRIDAPWVLLASAPLSVTTAERFSTGRGRSALVANRWLPAPWRAALAGSDTQCRVLLWAESLDGQTPQEWRTWVADATARVASGPLRLPVELGVESYAAGQHVVEVCGQDEARLRAVLALADNWDLSLAALLAATEALGLARTTVRQQGETGRVQATTSPRST